MRVKLKYFFIAFVTFVLGCYFCQKIQRLPESIWVKLDTATCTYNEKSCGEFSAFRSLNGEIYVYLPESHPNNDDDSTVWKYPWDYIIRPKDVTKEIAHCDIYKSRKYAYCYDSPETYKYRSSVDFQERVVVAENYVEFISAYRNVNVRITW
jgi:hypothetical protein